MILHDSSCHTGGEEVFESAEASFTQHNAVIKSFPRLPYYVFDDAGFLGLYLESDAIR